MKSENIYQPQSNTAIGAILNTASGFTAANPGTAPTNTVLVCSAQGTDESCINSLVVSSDDSAARTIQWWRSSDGGTTKRLIGISVIAALSGSATLVNIDVLRCATITGLELDDNLQPIIRLGYTGGVAEQLYACVITAAVTASKTLYITGNMANYSA